MSLDALFKLAEIYKDKMDDLKRTRIVFKKILKIQPDNKEAEKALRKLDKLNKQK